MSSTQTSIAAAEADPAVPTEPARTRLVGWLRRPDVRDGLICLGYLALAGYVFGGLWADPYGRALANNWADQVLNEWFLAHGTLFFTGDMDLVTDRLNTPDGINLMANASLIFLGIALTPVTLIFGAPVSFVLALTIALAGTAAGWYLLLHHELGLSRAAAAVGGGFAGFAPGMISQSNSHLHMTAQFLVPAMVWCLIRLARGWRPVLTGVTLAALAVVQLFNGEEVLFLAAVTCGLFVAGYALFAPLDAARRLPRFALGGALAVALALPALAYPLWLQFSGPQSVPNGPFSPAYYYADVASYLTFPQASLAGSPQTALPLSKNNPAEQNAFFGIPLLLVVAGSMVLLWREVRAWALLLAGVVMALLSFGPQVTYRGVPTGEEGLFAKIAEYRVVESALPTRFSLAVIPVIGVLLALGLDRGLRLQRWRLVVPVAVAVALLPLFPTPLPTIDRGPVPGFIRAGHWRTCTPSGGTLVPIPVPTPQHPDSMRWAAAADARFAIPEGFFIGPYAGDGKASMGIYPRFLSSMTRTVIETGVVPPIGDHERRLAEQDLRTWRADCVVLGTRTPNASQVLDALTQLLGPARYRAGAWYWDLDPEQISLGRVEYSPPNY